MKVIVIGGGPAGMLAAISAGMNKDDVTILEKMNMLGKKLLITGKGRCNITSSIPIDEFIKNVPGNGKFLYSCFNNFTNDDILNILKEEGLQTKVERGNRVFPITDKSQDVLQALLNRLKRLGVKIQTNTKVEEILLREGKVIGVTFNNNKSNRENCMLSVVLKSLDIMGDEINKEEVKNSDFNISLSIPSCNMFESNYINMYANLGYRTTKSIINDIKS